LDINGEREKPRGVRGRFAPFADACPGNWKKLLPPAVVGEPAYLGLTTKGEGQKGNIAAAAAVADNKDCWFFVKGEAKVTTGVWREEGKGRDGLVAIPVMGGGLSLIR